MLFNSYAFLIFLPLFMLGYWSTRGRARLWVMFLFSLVFYGWWDWRFLFLLLFSAIVDYSIGIVLENEQRDSARHRLIVLSVIVNLGLLGFFKYFNFFADSTARICESFGLPVTWNTLQIILPVGISFYVFKTMSYTIDVYRRTQTAERDLLKFATFVVFFPELVAGPIVRASRLLPQLKQDQRFDYERALSGISLICSGYVRKVVVADSLAPIVDVRFAHPEAHSALSLLIGVYFYAFQIYCDFSGYSTSPSASHAFSDSISGSTSSGRISRAASVNSGRAGTSRSLPGSATISTFPSAVAAAALSSPSATSCSPCSSAASGTARDGRSSRGADCTVSISSVSESSGRCISGS